MEGAREGRPGRRVGAWGNEEKELGRGMGDTGREDGKGMGR